MVGSVTSVDMVHAPTPKHLYVKYSSGKALAAYNILCGQSVEVDQGNLLPDPALEHGEPRRQYIRATSAYLKVHSLMCLAILVGPCQQDWNGDRTWRPQYSGALSENRLRHFGAPLSLRTHMCDAASCRPATLTHTTFGRLTLRRCTLGKLSLLLSYCLQG